MIKLLLLCLISTRHVLTQTVAWTVGTSLPRFNEDLNLTCTVSEYCCKNYSRVWERGTGIEILKDGKSDYSDRYSEDWDQGTTGFNLIINKLQVTDVNKSYKCQYRVGEDDHVLTQDATWEFQPIEECTFRIEYGSSILTARLTGKLYIARSAPYPSIFATYAGDNQTVDVIGLTQFGNWFYNFTVSINKEINCVMNDKFILSVVTGTSVKKVCDVDFCKCGGCTGKLIALGVVLPVIGGLAVLLHYGYRYYKHRKSHESNNKGSEKKTVLKILAMYGLVFTVLHVVLPLVIGIFVCPCQETWLWILILFVPWIGDLVFILMIHSSLDIVHLKAMHSKKALFGLLTGGIPLIYTTAIDRECCKGTGKEEDPVKVYVEQGCEAVLEHKVENAQEGWFKQMGNSWKEIALVGNKGYRVSTKPALFKKTSYTLRALNVQPDDAGIYRCAGDYYFKLILSGGKSQSVESGSSCWPICRVGQDPNTSSSNPEKVRRSPKKERADKKPTDFARSPENERADKKKERKPTEVVRPQPTRPLPPMHLKTDNTGRAEYSTETEIFKPPALPSINKASDSPRPLPQKPPGTQLDPLRESTSEKKKKKKRKKKEPKQSDEEN